MRDADLDTNIMYTREVLLVSGSGPKKQLDAVSCLER